MINFNTKALKMADLSYEEQAIVALIEILDRVANGDESLPRVEYVLSDLYGLMPWLISDRDTQAIIDRVASYGICELPGHVEKDENSNV